MRRAGALFRRGALVTASLSGNCKGSWTSPQTAVASEWKACSQAGRRSFASGTASTAGTPSDSTSLATYGLAGVALAGAAYYFIGHRSTAISVPTGPASGQAVQVSDSFSNNTAAGTGPGQVAKFHAKDQHDNDWTHEDLMGEFALMLATPDIASADIGNKLEYMTQIVQQSDRKSNMHLGLYPVLVALGDVNVDQFKQAGEAGHERILCLRGADTSKILDSLKVAPGIGRSQAAGEGNQLYFLDPEGHVHAAFPLGEDPRVIADQIASEVKAWKLKNPSWHGPKSVKPRHA